MNIVTGILAAAVASGTVLVLAGLGELLAERSGVQNLGLEGVMAMGAVTAIMTERSLPNPYVGLLVAMLVGLCLGVVYATATVAFRANQVLCGLGLAFFGNGLSARLGAPLAGWPTPAPFLAIRIPLLADIPVLGQALFNQTILVYVAYFLLPPLVTYLLFHTRHGMHVRAVGENPAAADACGISVNGLRFLYACVGCVLAAVSGAYITLAYTPSWIEGITAGRGWIAIALVIFGAWRPAPVLFGALLFGVITSLGFVAQIHNWAMPPAFLSMLPYLGTMVFMIIPVAFKSKALRRISSSPAGLGLPYLREGG